MDRSLRPVNDQMTETKAPRSARGSSSKGKQILGSFALGLVILLGMIGLGLVIVFSARILYSANIGRWGLERISGMPREEILLNYDALMRWCWPWHTAELAFPTLSMSANGAQHFAECKALFNFFTLGGAMALFVGIANILRMRRTALSPDTGLEDARSECRVMTAAGVVSILIPVVLLLAAAVDFDRTFVLFHKLFFGNDLWIFDYRTDPVILILPETYFLLCAVVISLTVLAGGIAVIIMGLRLRKRLDI